VNHGSSFLRVFRAWRRACGRSMPTPLQLATAGILISCWVEAGISHAETSPTLAMSSASECTQCHLVWLEDFAQSGAELLVPYQRDEGYQSGREGAESTDLMCFSCHDGYVADSRARIRLGHQHPMAGISKLQSGRRPHGLPLLREEEVYCGTCHTPHGPGHVPSSNTERARVDLEHNAFLRLTQRPGPIALCVQCHEYTTSTAATGGNHPVGHDDFPLPPELARIHGQPNTEKGGIGCQTCHSLHGAANPLLVLLGGTDGSSSSLCAVCHENDLSQYGLGPYSHPVGVSPTTNHGQSARATFPNGELIRLSADGKMSCLSCHDVHDGRVPQNLLRESPLEGDFCGTCHMGMAGRLEGSEHDLRVSAPQAKNILGKTVDQSGICGACHVVHKGRSLSLWAQTPRSGPNVVDRLCLSCHATGGMAQSKLRGPAMHPTPIDKSLIRLRVDGSDPSFSVSVYDDEGQPAERGSVTCLTCHDAHKWQPDEVPAVEYPPVGTGNSLNSFLRTRSQDQICKYCHGVRALWRYQYFHSSLRHEK